MGSIFDNILNLLSKILFSNIEQVFLSIQKLPFLRSQMFLKNLFGSQKVIFLNLFLSKYKILFLSIKSNILPLSEIINLQFAIGLFGKSFPLIFNSQLTFSLALTYK